MSLSERSPGCRIFLDPTRYPAQFPPPFGSSWGDDEFGLWVEIEVNGVVQRLRWIEPGTFWMGSREEEVERSSNEGPRHQVTLTQGFWLADTTCTQALWVAVVGDNPSHFRGDQRPVERVSWDDIQPFLRGLERLLPEAKASLPTEAEWEFACRAATESPFSFGAQVSADIVNYDGTYPYAGDWRGRFRNETVEVKALLANRCGLFQMHGNVWEWCADSFRTYDADPRCDPHGAGDPAEESSRAIRGGSWIYDANWARSAFRRRARRGVRDMDIGFRFCLRSGEPATGHPPGGQSGV